MGTSATIDIHPPRRAASITGVTAPYGAPLNIERVTFAWDDDERLWMIHGEGTAEDGARAGRLEMYGHTEIATYAPAWLIAEARRAHRNLVAS